MVNIASRYETGAKTFLGTTMPASTDASATLALALDAIFAHPNVGPFVSRQLIQHLVTSNPSPAYVARVATVFNDDGSGIKGNLKAVVKAILLDDDARSATIAAGASAGKLREPMLRFAGWARAWNASSASNAWASATPRTRRPGSARARCARPPSSTSSGRATCRRTARSQRPAWSRPSSSSTTNRRWSARSTIMQRAISGQGVGDLVADYSALLALADDTTALVGEINLVLAADQLERANAATIATAVATLPAGTDAQRLKRIYAALTLTVAAPDFVVLK